MTLSNDRIIYLLERYTNRSATLQELQELTIWMAQREDDTPLHLHLQNLVEQPATSLENVNWDQLYAGIEEQMTGQWQPSAATDDGPARIVPFRSRFLRYAVAILLILGAITVAWFVVQHNKHNTGQEMAKNTKPSDILPGRDRAVLTLADGRDIVVDSSVNGQLAQQGNVSIVKTSDGQIVYRPRGIAGRAVLQNTMTTPRGSQFQLVLPDGTKAWLNAASSISYPVAFAGDERRVKVSGEVYFEVARRPGQAFVVDIGGRSSVEVLGTFFNINAYDNEPSIRTTLLTGSIRVADAGSEKKILKPGQQAVIANPVNKQPVSKGISILSDVDLDKTVAWKNGMFDFDNADIRTIMNQLERWYDIEVRFEGKPPAIVFRGEMYRNVNLSTMIGFFKGNGLHVRLEGKTLIVEQ